MHGRTLPSAANVEVQSVPAIASENVTEPVGSVNPVSVTEVGETTALKLTGWFTEDGLGEGVETVTEVPEAFTIWLNGGAVEPVKLGSPLV